MPIPLPNLDDRAFDDLVAEGQRLIPGLAPSWTDHNPSDPGIAFIELFAYVTEMLLYRADRVGEANKQAFVKLLRGDPEWTFEKPVDEEIRDAVLELRRETRAVSARDFETLALSFHSKDSYFPVSSVARAYCLSRCDADVQPRDFKAKAHVSVFIVPNPRLVKPDDAAKLTAALLADLIPRCLLTTRPHVVLPNEVEITVHLEIHVFADQIETTIRARVLAELELYFSKLEGGPDHTGWPFGRAVLLSELYALLDTIEGVDYIAPDGVNQPIQSTSNNREILAAGNKVIGIKLEPDELVKFPAHQPGIVIKRQATTIPEE
jgi:hypothetical protein